MQSTYTISNTMMINKARTHYWCLKEYEWKPLKTQPTTIPPALLSALASQQEGKPMEPTNTPRTQ